MHTHAQIFLNHLSVYYRHAIITYVCKAKVTHPQNHGIAAQEQKRHADELACILTDKRRPYRHLHRHVVEHEIKQVCY